MAPGPQAAGRPRDRERLMAELVGRDEEHLHVMTISMRAAAVPQRGFDRGGSLGAGEQESEVAVTVRERSERCARAGS